MSPSCHERGVNAECEMTWGHFQFPNSPNLTSLVYNVELMDKLPYHSPYPHRDLLWSVYLISCEVRKNTVSMERQNSEGMAIDCGQLNVQRFVHLLFE